MASKVAATVVNIPAKVIDTYVGKRIRKKRNEKGMIQEKLAALIGVTFQQLQKYESGTNRVSASRLYYLSLALGVPISYFFVGLKE